ncbi:hypothetical protein [Nocardia niwae]|uniref:hypothetical protein n=1 Tax=Nocardia niwae TaxID=626084 RepID=UPI0007A42840|nr:hypothetical protein [Nocardia niwae]
MALPDFGIAPPDVREAATEPRRMLGTISCRAAGARVSAPWSPGRATVCRTPLNNSAGHRMRAHEPGVWCHRVTDGTPLDRRKILDPAAIFVPGETQEVPVLENPLQSVWSGTSMARVAASSIPAHTSSTSSANPSEAR